jgi:Putative Ig domain
MSGLRAAGGDVPIFGMTYYDPLLAAWYTGAWFQGETGPATARASIPVLHSPNDTVTGIYAHYGTPVADVQKPFQSGDWKLTGSFMGQVLPQNVADICNWTHMCMTGGANPNIHTTDYGHALIAAAYGKVLRVPASISGTPPPAVLGHAYAFPFTAGGIPAVKVKGSGTLPAGLSWTKTGLLSGTPTRSGTFPVTVTASNSGGTASDAVTIGVS